MKQLGFLLKRNIKLFFKDKGTFFTSLITPCILLVLYSTFLAGIYEDSFMASIPEPLRHLMSDGIVGGFVGGQLVSSLLAVSAVTVAFGSNMLMVQDKLSGARKDLSLTPVQPYIMSLAYFLAALTSTLIVCYTALGLSMIYLAFTGWYLSLGDCLLLVLDVLLQATLGTAISSLISYFMSTQGQISAVGSIVSSCYGFICGAYMPLSSFSEGLRNALSFFPGTYGTSLLRNHSMRGVFAELEELGLPESAVEAIRDGVDCNLYFFGERVGIGAMYLVLTATVAVVLGTYVLVNYIRIRRRPQGA